MTDLTGAYAAVRQLRILVLLVILGFSSMPILFALIRHDSAPTYLFIGPGLCLAFLVSDLWDMWQDKRAATPNVSQIRKDP